MLIPDGERGKMQSWFQCSAILLLITELQVGHRGSRREPGRTCREKKNIQHSNWISKLHISTVQQWDSPYKGRTDCFSRQNFCLHIHSARRSSQLHVPYNKKRFASLPYFPEGRKQYEHLISSATSQSRQCTCQTMYGTAQHNGSSRAPTRAVIDIHFSQTTLECKRWNQLIFSRS